MRQVTSYQLWLGHAGNARDLRRVLDAGIVAIVDLALSEPPVAVSRELVYCRFPLVDGAGNPLWLLRTAIDTVAGLIRHGTPTLVACGAGMSRAPVIAAAAIAQLRGCSLADCLSEILQTGPADVSPALAADVCALVGADDRPLVR